MEVVACGWLAGWERLPRRPPWVSMPWPSRWKGRASTS